MDQMDFDRFAESESCAKNGQQRKSARGGGGTSVLLVCGLFTVLACAAILFVFKTDAKESSFDELVTTGGAVRKRELKFPQCDTKECRVVRKYVQESLNTSYKPCDNFYKFACAGWIKRNPIPQTSSTFSTFTKLNQKVEVILRGILEDKKIVKNPKQRRLLKKVRDFYASCMDQKSIELKKDRPLKELIDLVGGWSMANDGSWDEGWEIIPTLLKIHKNLTSSGGPLFSVHVSDDPRHADKHVLEIDQAGPSLPREIYLKTDPEKEKTLKAYKEYMIDVSRLLGYKGEIEKNAQDTIAFEKRLAEISVPDDIKQETWFHRMTIKQLQEQVPDFQWHVYVNQVFEGRYFIPETESIIAPAVKYLKKMMKVVNETPKSVLSNYIVWSVIQDEVPYLSKIFLKARMRYKEKVLGSKGLRKRWKTCVSYTNEYLGEIIAREYKEKHFKETTKEIASGMITNIREAFKDNVRTLDWMDLKTKKTVEEKADFMKDQVGYPSYINNDTRFETKYHDLLLVKNDFFGNRLSMIKFAHNRMLNKLRKKVDKTEWPMDPQTINAMYSFNQNGMIIPAGILQPPFFHGVDQSMAMLYGAIGSILGHELTHGFDNTGRKFNKKGELAKQWWSNESLANFKKRSECIVKQYSNYKVRGKYRLNGKLTLGENIADNGGFKTALKAYYNWLESSKGDNLVAGLKYTNDQLFHIAFAQAYCSNSRPSEQYLAILNDRHSEEEFRVIGTLSNSKEFAEAFNCPLNSPMNPARKCSVWTASEKKS